MVVEPGKIQLCLDLGGMADHVPQQRVVPVIYPSLQRGRLHGESVRSDAPAMSVPSRSQWMPFWSASRERNDSRRLLEGLSSGISGDVTVGHSGLEVQCDE